MKTYHVIKLTDITPLHIGKGRNYYDSYSDDLLSDTLSSALAAIRANIIGKKDDIESFMNSFLISSAFPFCKNDYFLPKPIGKIEIGIDDKYRKNLKKIKYIDKDTFVRKFLENEKLDITLEQLHGNLIVGNKCSNTNTISIGEESERVVVYREESKDATTPYYIEKKFFSSQCGLYCLIDSDEETFQEIFNLFEILGEEGIGSDKNVGLGHFKVETDTMELPVITSNNKLLLSTYIPTEKEMNIISLENSQYNLILRGGYMAGNEDESKRHFLKKAIYMISSGSVINCSDDVYGKIVNLRNEFSEHDIFRSGKALVIPIIF